MSLMKKLRLKILSFLTVRLLAVLTFSIGFAFVSFSPEKEVPMHVFYVKVPPYFDEKTSDEERFWRIQKLIFPQTEIPNPIPEGLPNFCGFLYVSLEQDGKIKLNSQTIGAEISNLTPLTEDLAEIFRQREENGVYEENSDKVVKVVIVKVPLSTKYGDFMKIIDAVKASGAEPIALQIDELPAF